MQRAKNANNSFLFTKTVFCALIALLGCVGVVLFHGATATAQSSQGSEISVSVEDPSPVLRVVSVEYYTNENGQRYAKVTAQVRFVATLQAYRGGVLIDERTIDQDSVWTTHVFDIPLPDEDEYEIRLRAIGTRVPTIAEDEFVVQYKEDTLPPDEGGDGDDNDSGSGNGGSGGPTDNETPRWLRAPNTGGMPFDASPGMLVAIVGVVVGLIFAAVARRYRPQKK